MWELDHKEGWVLKSWCFWAVVLEMTPLGSKEIKTVNSKGHQSWLFIGRSDTEAEAPILWPLDVKSQLFGKDPDTGRDWGREEKRVTEDEMVGWHHQLNGHVFEETLAVGEGRGSLVCFSPWSLSRTQLCDWTELNWISCFTTHTRTQFPRVLSNEVWKGILYSF